MRAGRGPGGLREAAARETRPGGHCSERAPGRCGGGSGGSALPLVFCPPALRLGVVAVTEAPAAISSPFRFRSSSSSFFRSSSFFGSSPSVFSSSCFSSSSSFCSSFFVSSSSRFSPAPRLGVRGPEGRWRHGEGGTGAAPSERK